MFKAEIIGNLGSDVEIKSDNAHSYAQFSVADTRAFKMADGSQRQVTNWVTCFYHSVESAVLPYLKKGQKVFVRGNLELRVFSSEKERQMKAGASITVQEIELVGGLSDEVPATVALPSGQLLEVRKFFWADFAGITPTPSYVYDKRGSQYSVSQNGFITKSGCQAQQQPVQQPEQQPE